MSDRWQTTVMLTALATCLLGTGALVDRCTTDARFDRVDRSMQVAHDRLDIVERRVRDLEKRR